MNVEREVGRLESTDLQLENKVRGSRLCALAHDTYPDSILFIFSWPPSCYDARPLLTLSELWSSGL